MFAKIVMRRFYYKGIRESRRPFALHDTLVLHSILSTCGIGKTYLGFVGVRNGGKNVALLFHLRSFFVGEYFELSVSLFRPKTGWTSNCWFLEMWSCLFFDIYRGHCKSGHE